MASASRYLSHDELTVVLSFLPAKFIMKLRTLSREVPRSSACDHFLLTQSLHTKADAGFFTRPYFYPVDLTLLDPDAGIPSESLRLLQHTERVLLASANGLVFFANKSRSLSSLCVCNPVHPNAALRFIPPPTGYKPEYRGSCISVAVDPMSRDYKLVCLTNTPEWDPFYWCRVYDSADDAWKFERIINGGPRNLKLESPVICDRTVYVASTCGPYMLTGPYIVAFDIEEEGSEIISFPGEAMEASDFQIARWGEKSLCLISFQGSVFKLWVMYKDEGRTWIEIYQVSIIEMGLTSSGVVHSFGLINSDTLVFGMDSDIYSYNIEKGALKELEKDYPSAYLDFIPYANSLRPI